jgi:hypothetical protein
MAPTNDIFVLSMREDQTPAVYALAKLHTELGGRISDDKQEAAGLPTSMTFIENALLTQIRSA